MVSGSLHAVNQIVQSQGLMHLVEGGEEEFKRRSNWEKVEPKIIEHELTLDRKERWTETIAEHWSPDWVASFQPELWPKDPSERLLAAVRGLAVEGFKLKNVATAVSLATKTRMKTVKRGVRREEIIMPSDAEKAAALLRKYLSQSTKTGKARFEIDDKALKRIWKEGERASKPQNKGGLGTGGRKLEKNIEVVEEEASEESDGEVEDKGKGKAKEVSEERKGKGKEGSEGKVKGKAKRGSEGQGKGKDIDGDVEMKEQALLEEHEVRVYFANVVPLCLF